MAQVTASDIRELLTARIMDPILIEWDSEEFAYDDIIEVVSSTLGYTDREGRFFHGDFTARVLATANDLRQMGDWDTDNPTAEDFEAFAQMVNEG